jgi:hypothetical protein
MESLLLSPRFAPTPTSSPLFSRSRLRPSLQLPPRLRHRHVRLRSTPGGSDAAEDEARATIKDDDLWTVARKVLDAYRSSDNDLRTFLQNLVDAGLADESEVFGSGGKDDDELLRAFLDADVSPDLGALWKLPALAAFSFAGVPALLGYFGDAAGVERVPAWMPLVYSLSSFLLGSLLVADASVGDEEWEELGDRGGGDLAFLESEEVLQRMTWRVPAAALAATAAGVAALRVAGEVTGVHDLQPPVWVAFLLFGLLFGVPYGVLSASFDPAVQGSWLGWHEFVSNIRDVALRADDHDRGRK